MGIATMDKTNPEVIKQIETILENRLSSLFTQEVSISGGVKSVAEIMNRLDRSTERSLLGTLQEQDGELAESIRRLMFTFEDIVSVDDRGVQRILKEIDQRDLALALKASGSEVSGKIFKNMSERAAGILNEEIGYLGPVRLRDVEESQRRIVEVLRRLEEEGFVVSTWTEGESGPQRRDYELTGEGRALAEDWVAHLKERQRVTGLLIDVLSSALGHDKPQK